jgi:hypothetical protein
VGSVSPFSSVAGLPVAQQWADAAETIRCPSHAMAGREGSTCGRNGATGPTTAAEKNRIDRRSLAQRAVGWISAPLDGAALLSGLSLPRSFGI